VLGIAHQAWACLRRMFAAGSRPLNSALRRKLALSLRYAARAAKRAGAVGADILRAIFWAPRSILYLLDTVRMAWPIAKYVRTSGIDVIHTILPHAYLVGACASVLSGRRPVLMSRLSLNHYQQEHRLVGFIERCILHRTVTAAIGNSNAVLHDL